jgi:hypothetical protein
LLELIKTAYDIFHKLFSVHFHKFSKIAYKNGLKNIQKQLYFIFYYRDSLCKFIRKR